MLWLQFRSLEKHFDYSNFLINFIKKCERKKKENYEFKQSNKELIDLRIIFKKGKKKI